MLLHRMFGTTGPSQLHKQARIYLSGVCQIQIAAIFLDPQIDHMPQLRQVIKGTRVHAVRIGRHPCLTITPSILCKLRRLWLEGSPTFNNIMLWAASTTTLIGFCKSGEVTLQSSTNKSTYVF